MTGKELAKAIRKQQGKLYAFVAHRHDGLYAPVEKAFWIDWAVSMGDSETGFKLDTLDGIATLGSED